MVRNVFICHTISLFYLLDIFAPVAALCVVYLLFIMLNWSGYCLFKQANGLCEWFSSVCVCVCESECMCECVDKQSLNGLYYGRS